MKKTLLVIGALALASTAEAARTLVDTLPLTVQPRYLTGVGTGFVAATSGSSGDVAVVDLRNFEELEFPLSLGSTFFARSINASGGTDPALLIGDNKGYVNVFYLSEIQEQADGGLDAANYPFLYEAAGADPITAVAGDPLGSSIYAGNLVDEAVGRFAFDGTAVLPPALLGHAPMGAAYVTVGVADRVFFGSDDGFLPWVDAGSLSVGATMIDGTGTHDFVVAGGTFAGNATRVIVLDKDADTLYLVDPSTLTILDSIGLAANPVAIAVSGQPGSAILWVAEDGTNQIESFTEALAQSQPPIALGGAPYALAEVDGRLYAGIGSSLAVITDRPWIEITQLNPSTITGPGQPVQVTYSSSAAGNARVTVNGTEIATGSAAVGSNVITLGAADVLAELVEGDPNRVRVEVTATTGSLVGHDEGVLLYDIPPGAPVNFRVGFGDRKVVGTWDRNPDTAELQSYRVWFGTDTFLTGVDGLASPQDVTADVERYTVTVSNGTTVYMAVAAVDSAGNLSARTNVLSATAQPTSGASDLSGDDGGFLFGCAVSGARGGSVVSILLVLALGLLRRRS